jgi:hypothetical protein
MPDNRGDELGENLHLLHGHPYWPRRELPDERAGVGRGGAGPSYAGVGPRNYRRADGRILEEVCDVLTRDPNVDASDVEVDVENGEVSLSGTIPTRSQKRLAEDLAAQCLGVHDVHNRLKVQRAGDDLGAQQVLDSSAPLPRGRDE